MKITISLITALLINSFGYFNNLDSIVGSYSVISEETTIEGQDGLEESIKRGKTVYEDFCMQCHLPTGKGVAGVYPPLAKADYLIKNRKAAIHAVKYGLKGEITVNGNIYNSVMPAPGLYNNEVADVMNYILHSWGNSSSEIEMVTEDEVKAIEE